MGKFSIENIERIIVKEYNVVELKSMYIILYKGITKLVALDYIVRDINGLNLKYDDYINLNHHIDLFLNDEITLRELINRIYLDTNVFMFKLKYISKPEKNI